MQDHQAAQKTGEGRALIEQIRRSEYMIGMTLAPDAEAAAEGMRRKLNSALRLLSDDLYSTKTHFILELVQNADDNAYAIGVGPEIHLTLSSEALTIWNNELGFTQANVRALCSVGESTKSRKVGFIGEKGIGFKSVFQVSNAPQIHSNGFHFRFDMSKPEEHLGYVVPHWIEPSAAHASEGTTIVLPAKPSESFTSTVLSELDARLLLFLRKLRRIDLRTPDERVSMRRLDEDGFVALLTSRQSTDNEVKSSRQRYLRVAVNVSMAGAIDEKRPSTPDSEIVLAFPVDDAGKSLSTSECATFAFLPIRAFGFRFCIQADFLLSSAREDIQTARPWNAALRDAIAPAFVASLQHFRNRPALARTFLQFLPQEQELTHGFFAPVVQQMLEALAGTDCVLCATGQWRKPAEVMTAPAAFQRLVPADQAWKIFGKDYPAPDLEVEPSTLKRLGCAPLYVADVVKVFVEHGDWVREQGPGWLVQYFRYLATLNRRHLLDAGVEEARCLPVSDGTLQSPSSGTVFTPLARGKKFGFEQELRILDEAFIDLLEEKDEADIRSLLHDLGVRAPEPYTLITNHILPAHKTDRWRDSSFSALTGHVRYVKAKLRDYLDAATTHGQSDASALEILRKGLRLKTKKNEDSKWWFQLADDVYLGREYQPEFDIEALLQEKLDCLRLVSPDYLPPGLDKLDPQTRATVLAEWRDFFFRIGVNPSPRLSGEGNAACSSELAILLGSDSAAIRRQTLECLDRNWHRYSSHATYSQSSKPGTRYYTSFATTLRTTIAPTRQRRSASLQEAYYPIDIVKDVFGSSPTYIDAELLSEDFLDICGIVHRVDVSACIKRLKQIKATEKPSAAHVRPLYRHLDQIFDRNASRVREAFQEHALILTRSDESPWRGPDEVVWSPPGEFLSRHYPALQGQYADSHGFFVRKLGVPHEVSIAAAVRALPSLTEAGLTVEAQAAEALRIYARASRELASPLGSAAPAWLADFKARPVFLNHRGEMVTLSDVLYADDQPATSALFGAHDDISFLAVPATRLPQIRVLLDTAGVPLLSNSLEIKLQDPGTGRPNTTLSAKVRERYRYIARLVYAQSHTVFERAKEAGLWRRLSLLRVLDVDTLTICTSLQGITATAQGEVVISGECAFVRSGAKGVVDRLSREICLMLKAPMTLVDGVSRVLRDEEIGEVEEYLDVREIPALPDDELSQLTLEHAPPASENPQSPELSQDQDEGAPVQAPARPSQETASPSTANAAQPPAVTVPSTGAPQKPLTSPSAQLSTVADALPASAPLAPTSNSASGSSTAATPAKPERPENAPIHQGANRSGSAKSTATKPGWTGNVRRRGRHQGTRAPSSSDPGHRLLSYVEPAPVNRDLSGIPDEADRARDRDVTAQAAVQHFLQTQQTKWATLEEMPPYNKGFDVRGIAHDGSEHFIEIKGQSAAWTAAGIVLTPSELLCAAEKREHYWLCIVEHAIQPGRQILHLVNNPFGKTDQFRFDSGWKATAISETGAPPLVPVPGLRIEIQGLGSGTIISVKKAGNVFCKLHVHLADGRQVFKVFEPARMRLSQGD